MIINPLVAGRGKISEIEWRLKRGGLEYKTAFSKRAGQCRELAKEHAGEYEMLVAVGGDGTVNEVANGIMDSGAVDSVLGVIPVGRGNDFARSIGFPIEYREACDRLFDDKVRVIDIGKANDRYFVGTAGVGFFAESMLRFPSWPFPARYLVYIAVLRTLLEHKNADLTISINGKDLQGKIFGISINNGKYIGAGSPIAPQAEMDDGLLDIIVFKDISRLEAVSNFSKVIEGTHLEHPKVEMYRGRRIKVLGTKVYYHTDGEVVGRTPATFEVYHKKLRVKV